MPDRSPREELHHLVDSLPDDQVERLLDDARRRAQPRVTPPDSAFAWMGTITDGARSASSPEAMDALLAEGFGSPGEPEGDETGDD